MRQRHQVLRDGRVALGMLVVLVVGLGLSGPATAVGSVAVGSVGGAAGTRVAGSGVVAAVLGDGDLLYRPAGPIRLRPGTPLAAGESLTVTIPAVPAGSRLASLNVTVSGATTATQVSVCPVGSACTGPSTVDVVAGTPTPAAVAAPLTGVAGDEVIVRNSAGSVVVYLDLNGFFVGAAGATAGGGQYVPVAPYRALSYQAVAARSVHTLDLTGVPAGATAVVLDLAFSSATERSYVAACPVDLPTEQCARTSVLNPVVGKNRSNLTIVAIGGARGNRIALYNSSGTVRLNADVQGYVVGAPAAAAGAFRPVPAARVMTSRLEAGLARTVTLTAAPEGATAVSVRLAASSASSATAIAACPGTVASSSCSRTSVVNVAPGESIANSAIVPLGGDAKNQFTVSSSLGGSNLAVDVLGFVVVATAEPPPVVVPPPAVPPAPVKPGSGTTGVPVGTRLTPHYGDITVTTPGTVLDSMDIFGFVTIRAANVTIKNSRVRGSGPGTYNRGLVSCLHALCLNAVIQDSTLVPDRPSVWLNGILGHDFTARRVNVYNVVDGFGVHNVSNGGGPVNVVLEGNYCHDLSYFAVDPNQGNGPTHNDCIQLQGGSNIRIVGNSLQSFMSLTAGDQTYSARNRGAGIMVTPNVAPVTGAVVSGNWIDGGEASVHISTGRYASMRFGRLTGNLFGRNQFDFGGGSKYVIRVSTRVAFDNALTTNLWAAGGALAVGRDLGIRYDP